MEESIIRITTWLHAAAGVVALVVVPLAMMSAKGGAAHRRLGKWFVKALVALSVTGVVLGVLNLNWVLVMLAVLSMHLAASGYRSLYHKKLHEGQKPVRADMLVQGMAAVANGGFFIWGAIGLFFGQRDPITWAFVIFGSSGLLLVLANTHRFYKHAHDKNEWLFGHMMGFIGSYIVTLVAFSGVNLPMLGPDWLRWAWPVIVGVPLMIIWIRILKGRFTKGRRAKYVYPTRLK